MAGRPGRDRLTGRGDPPVDRDRPLVLLQLGLLGCLAAGAVAFVLLPPGGDDCCLSPGVLGLFPLAELLLLLVALGLRWWYGRWGAVAVVDGLVATPLPAFLLALGPAGPGLLVPVALVALGVALAGALLAIGRVRAHPIERIGVAGAFLALAIALSGVLLIAAVPLVLLAVTAWPQGLAGAASRSAEPPVASQARPATNSAERAAGGRRAPDAASILARRDPGPDEPG